MTDREDPQRWSHGAPDAPPHFVELAAETAALPSAAQLASMLSNVAAQVGRPELAQTTSAPATGAGVSALGATTGMLVVAGLVALALISGGVLWWRHDAAENPAPDSAPAGMAAQPTPTPTAPTAVPAVRATVPVLPAPSAPALEPAAGTRPVATATQRLAARSARAGNASEDPVAELALLERAQRALRSDPSAALALAETHRTRFARGALAQEREMLAIEALLRLQRRAAAERRARQFVQRYPGSSHLPRLQDLLRSTP